MEGVRPRGHWLLERAGCGPNCAPRRAKGRLDSSSLCLDVFVGAFDEVVNLALENGDSGQHEMALVRVAD